MIAAISSKSSRCRWHWRALTISVYCQTVAASSGTDKELLYIISQILFRYYNCIYKVSTVVYSLLYHTVNAHNVLLAILLRFEKLHRLGTHTAQTAYHLLYPRERNDWRVYLWLQYSDPSQDRVLYCYWSHHSGQFVYHWIHWNYNRCHSGRHNCIKKYT